MSELTKQLRIKAGMINLGERIEWGSETALMETAANRIDHLEAELAKLRAGQEPVAYITGQFAGRCVIEAINRAAPRQPEGDYGWLVNLELPEVQCNCAWNPDSHDKTCPVYLRDRLTDAQARLAEKNARIAEQQGAAIELARLLNEACEEIRELKAQLQAAPAERGVVRQETNFVASTGEGRNPLYEGQFDDETPEQAAHRLHWARTAMEVQSAIAEWQQRCQYNADTAYEVAAERDTLRQQRDRLAGLLADVKADYTHAIHWEDMHATMKRIDAAISAVEDSD